MSDDDNPVAPLFELQRDAIRQTEETLDSVFEMTTMFGDAVSQGADPARDVQEQTIELSRQSIHASLDAVASVTEDTEQVDDLQDAIDDVFDQIRDQSEALSYAVEDGYDAINEDAVGNLEDQIDLLMDLNRTVEDRLVDTLEMFADQADASGEYAGDVQEQVDRLTEQFQSQTRRMEEMAERLSDLDFEDDED